MNLTWNPLKLFGVFSSSTLEYPQNILEHSYNLHFKPMPFCNPKEFKKDLAKVVGKNVEHMIFDDKLLGFGRKKFNSLNELYDYVNENFYSICRYNGMQITVCGPHMTKILEKTPNGFGAIMFGLSEYIGQGSWEWRGAAQQIVYSYYEAMKLTGKKKEQVKGLPLDCKGCGAHFFKNIDEIDEDGDEITNRIDLDYNGTCESCGYLAGSVNNETLVKAYKYILQEEIVTGKKIIAA